MMNRRIVVSVVVLALALGLTACMGGMVGGGMMGGGMTHGGSSAGLDAAAGSDPLVQESTVGDIKIVVSYPATAVGTELSYGVNVTDVLSGRPMPDAHVRAQVRMASAPQSSGRSAEHGAMSNAQMVTPAVRRLDVPGTFAFSHQMDAPGAYEITVIVDAIGDKPRDPPVKVFAVRAAPMNRTSHSTGFRATPTLIVTGAVMLAMMLLMTRRF
jgi:hypothetical protein